RLAADLVQRTRKTRAELTRYAKPNGSIDITVFNKVFGAGQVEGTQITGERSPAVSNQISLQAPINLDPLQIPIDAASALDAWATKAMHVNIFYLDVAPIAALNAHVI